MAGSMSWMKSMNNVVDLQMAAGIAFVIQSWVPLTAA